MGGKRESRVQETFTSVVRRFLSVRMRANTGKAVMEREEPMNMAKAPKCCE